MTWRVDLDPAAVRELGKLDPQIARRILGFLRDRVAVLDDPAVSGRPSEVPAWVSFGNTALATTASSAASKTWFCESLL